MTELKPCPFCGGEAKFVIDDYISSDTTQWHKIICKNFFECGCNLGVSISTYQPDYDKEVRKLKRRWNRRVDND